MSKDLKSGNYTIFALILFLAVSSIAIIPFLKQSGVIGHSLDWSIPENAANFAKMQEQAKYLWNDTYTEGFDMANGQVAAWCTFLIGMMGTAWGISGATISKLVAFLATFAPAFFMYLTAFYFLTRFSRVKKRWPIGVSAMIAGLIYGYSPIIFNQIIGGPITYFISYALLPLVILFTAKSVSETGRLKWAFIIAGGIAYGGAVIANQFVVFIAALVVLYIFFAPRFRKRYLWAFLLIAGQAILLNIYWLLPIVNNLFSTIKSLYTLKGAPTALSGLITHGIPFAEAINLTGFWNPYYIEALPPVANAIWLIAISIIIILAVSTIVFQKRNNLTMFSIAVLLISLFFVKGGLPPFGAVNMAIYTYFTPFFLFRTLHHILVLPTFGLAVLLAFWSLKKLSRPKRVIAGKPEYNTGSFYSHIISLYNNSNLFIPLWLSILLVVYISPFLFGLLNKDLKTFVSSPELQATVREIEQENGDYRLVYFPMSNSPKFLSQVSDEVLQGNDPNMAFSPTPLVTVDTGVDNDGKRFSRDAALAIYNDYPTALSLFSLLNSRYFVFLKDRLPAHYPRELAFFGQENYEELLQTGLEKRLGEPLRDSSVLSYWKYDNTLPVIYLSNQAVEVNDHPNSLLNLLNLDEVKNIQNPTFLFAGDVPDRKIEPSVKIDSIYIDSFDDTYISKLENWELGPTETKSNGINNAIEYEFTSQQAGDYAFDMAYSCEDRTISLEITLDDRPVEILDCEADSFDQFNLKSFQKIPLGTGGHNLRISESNKTKTLGSFHLYYFNFYQVADIIPETDLAELPKISFEKINQAHFRVNIDSATAPFFLNFLESYHPGWQAMIGGQPLGSHQVVNGYANGWLVERNGNYVIDLEYKPQQLYARASQVSLITLGLLSGLLLVSIIVEKHGHSRLA